MHKEDFLQKCSPARAAREYESNTFSFAAGNVEPAALTSPGRLLEMQPASPDLLKQVPNVNEILR